MTVHLWMQSVISVIKLVILLNYVHKTIGKMMPRINRKMIARNLKTGLGVRILAKNLVVTLPLNVDCVYPFTSALDTTLAMTCNVNESSRSPIDLTCKIHTR